MTASSISYFFWGAQLSQPEKKNKKQKTKKKNKTILIGFFSFPFKNIWCPKYTKNKWREIRDDRIFIFTYNQTWDAVSATLFFSFRGRRTRKISIWIWHIPRHPSLRGNQWVEPLYNSTILYSVYTYTHGSRKLVRSKLRGLVDQKVAHPNSFLTTESAIKLPIFRSRYLKNKK